MAKKALASIQRQRERETLRDIQEYNASSNDASNTDNSEHSFTPVEATLASFLNFLYSLDAGIREKKSSMQAVQEVRKIIKHLGGKIENIMDPIMLREEFFKKHSEKVHKPGTSKHISSLLSFMEYLIVDKISLNGCTADDYIVMKLHFNRWRQS